MAKRNQPTAKDISAAKARGKAKTAKSRTPPAQRIEGKLPKRGELASRAPRLGTGASEPKRTGRRRPAAQRKRAGVSGRENRND